MKTAIPWVLVAVLLGGVYFLYSTGNQRDAEWQQKNQELATLRTENERLKQVPDVNPELDRLKKENEELPRLRSEVGQLRAEIRQLTADLQKAQAQHGQIQQQQTQLVAETQALRAQAIQAQAQARTETCIDNLREIQSAKQRWAMEKSVSGGNAFPTLNDIAPYLPNHVLPVCPGGGTYSLSSVSTPPTCSVPGHVIPRD